MNNQMAYLVGMIIGNGEIQRDNTETTIVIDIPFKKLEDDEAREVPVYVKASLIDIRSVIEPLIDAPLVITEANRSIKISFTKKNEDYTVREIIRFVGAGTNHREMTMSRELFDITADEKKECLRGIADVTGYIRKSNRGRQDYEHRVYIEVPANWKMVIDIANLLKSVDVPIQSIDFGHPNFRDSRLKQYKKGRINYWKKEHQIKIYANEFLPIGFNIKHKQRALEKYSDELLKVMKPSQTHKQYWERRSRRRSKPLHPGENDVSLPIEIRGKHFDSWIDIAKELGFYE